MTSLPLPSNDDLPAEGGHHGSPLGSSPFGEFEGELTPHPPGESRAAQLQREAELARRVKLLRRLCLDEGDSDRFKQVCIRHSRDRAFLIEPDRLYEHLVTWMAMDAENLAQEEWGENWVQEKTDKAIAQILAEDLESELKGAPPESEDGPGHHAFLRMLFAMPLELTRRAAIRFNSLPEEPRQAFYVTILDAPPGENPIPTDEEERKHLRYLLRYCFYAVFLLDEPEPVKGVPRIVTDLIP